MGEHRRGDAADRNEAQDRDRKYLHFQVQIDGIHNSRSTSHRKTVREARVRTAAIVERDARMGGGWPPPALQDGLQFGTVGGSDAVCRSGLHRSSKAALAAQARVGNLGQDPGGALSQVGAGERRTHPARGIPAELQNSAVLSQSSARASTCAPARLSGFLIRLPETFSA